MKKFIVKLFVIFFILLIIAVFVAYKVFFSPNVICKADSYLYIPTSGSFENVLDSLEKNNYLKNRKTFIIASKIKHYDVLVKSGRYKLDSGETNWHLINKLRSGSQAPVMVYVPSVRTIDRLCPIVAKKMEFTANDLCNLLHDQNYIKKLGFDYQTIPALFIPNT